MIGEGYDESRLRERRRPTLQELDARLDLPQPARSRVLLEIAADLAEDGVITDQVIKEVVAGQVRRFDKGGEAFYDQISALHKSVRGSSPDGALYWLCRMLDGGCDPLYVARRVVRMASEDIGNADPRGLDIALNAWQVQERLGSPEGELAIAQAVVYLASAAKSNAVYSAYNQAMAAAKASGSLEVPIHLRNAPTRLMKELGYGRAYRYAHDEPGAYAAGETYLPEELQGQSFYHPVDRGLEIKIGEKLESLRVPGRRAGKQRKSVAGNAGRRLQQFRPGHRAVVGMQLRKSRHDARCGDGAVSLAYRIRRRRVAGRHLGHAVVALVAAIRGSHEDLDTAAQVAHRRLDDGQGKAGRDGGVSHIPTRGEHVAGRSGSNRVCRGDDAVGEGGCLVDGRRLATGRQRHKGTQDQSEARLLNHRNLPRRPIRPS